VWSVDGSGNYVNTLASAVAGASYALESLETTFHQDLNGDGTIGVVTRVIESTGTTSLVGVANNFFLNPTAGGTGPKLKYTGGTPVVAGQFDQWAPIGAEQTSSGYLVAWKVAGADLYTVWTVDSGGNYLSFSPVTSGSNPAITSAETTFHQDLNGDGTIGSHPTVLESAGSTALVQSGSNFFLNPTAGGTGPELKYTGGTPVVAGQFDQWAPIGAEQTSSGYLVAWKVAGADSFTIWTVDSGGNYLSFSPVTSGSNPAISSAETTFHQDLNGNGVIGSAVTPILSLAEVHDGWNLQSFAGSDVSTVAEPIAVHHLLDPYPKDFLL
jgi:serralysin